MEETIAYNLAKNLQKSEEEAEEVERRGGQAQEEEAQKE